MRSRLIIELKQEGKLQLAPRPPLDLVQQAALSLVVQHLDAEGLRLSTSVLLPESGLNTAAKCFRDNDLLHILGLDLPRGILDLSDGSGAFAASPSILAAMVAQLIPLARAEMGRALPSALHLEAVLQPVPESLLEPRSVLINEKLTAYMQDCEFRMQAHLREEKSRVAAAEADLRERHEALRLQAETEALRVRAREEALALKEQLLQAEREQLEREAQQQSALFAQANERFRALQQRAANLQQQQPSASDAAPAAKRKIPAELEAKYKLQIQALKYQLELQVTFFLRTQNYKGMSPPTSARRWSRARTWRHSWTMPRCATRSWAAT
jgi:hypothetical protein